MAQEALGLPYKWRTAICITRFAPNFEARPSGQVPPVPTNTFFCFCGNTRANYSVLPKKCIGASGGTKWGTYKWRAAICFSVLDLTKRLREAP